MEITHRDLKVLINRCYKKKVPLDIKGAVGIGKSETTFEVAKEIARSKNKTLVIWNELFENEKIWLLDHDIEKSFIFVDVRLSQMDPTDLKGLPKINEKYVRWLPNLLFKVLSHHEADGIVFFDEMNVSPPSVTSACLQIINDHQIGETPISKDILFISAGNRLIDQASVFEESAALRNRRANVTLITPDINTWVEWAKKNDVDSRVMLFLKWKEDNLYKFEEDSKELSFPSPRMWKKASDLIYNIDFNETNENKLKLYVACCVGEVVAREFIGFLKLSEKVDVRDVLKNPEKIKEFSGRKYIDLRYSLIIGVSSLYIREPEILNDVLGLCNYIEPEMGMFMMRMIKGFYKGDNFSDDLQACENWLSVRDELIDYIF